MPIRTGAWRAAARAMALAALVMAAAGGNGALLAATGPSGPVSQVPARQAEPSGATAATATAAPSGPATDQAALPSTVGESSDPDATTSGKGEYASFTYIIIMAGGALLVLLAAIVAFIVIRRGRDPKIHQESEEPGMGYDNRPSSRRNLVQAEHREAVIEDLLRRMTVMEQRITALENGGAMRARPASPEPPPPARPQTGYGADQQDNYYDRRREPQDLPEDGWSASQRPPASGQPSAPPRAAQPGPGSLQQFADDLAQLFNRANKPDFDALASQYGAESYTNDRRGDLAQLIKDVNDRFWVVPVPGRPEYALMIPGFTVKKSWAKLRQPETDHPLAHHFELRRGDRLQVIKPAVLRRNSNNFWELEQKGEVVGIS